MPLIELTAVPKSKKSLLPEDMLLPRDTRRALPIALLRAREAVMVRFRPILRYHGVTEQQWRVMRVQKAHSMPERWLSGPA
jgi:hypothetical protein